MPNEENRRNILRSKDALTAASQVTDSLKRTKNQLVRELERSGTALEKLQEGNLVITKTLTEHDSYSEETKLANLNRKKMQQKENFDLMMITVAGGIYFLLVLYILIARYSFLVSWVF